MIVYGSCLFSDLNGPISNGGFFSNLTLRLELIYGPEVPPYIVGQKRDQKSKKIPRSRLRPGYGQTGTLILGGHAGYGETPATCACGTNYNHTSM